MQDNNNNSNKNKSILSLKTTKIRNDNDNLIMNEKKMVCFNEEIAQVKMSHSIRSFVVLSWL